MQRVFREYDEIHCAEIPTGFSNHLDDTAGLVRQVVARTDPRELQLHAADDNSMVRFIQSTKSVHLIDISAYRGSRLYVSREASARRDRHFAQSVRQPISIKRAVDR